MTKTILITGTSKGMGRIAAKFFAEKGWNVIATMRNPKQETELSRYPNVLVAELDITKENTITDAIQKSIERFEQIDVLLNNAAFGQFGLFEAVEPEQIEEQFRVNVLGTMNVTRAILPHFRQNKSGIITTISSAAGRIGMPMVSLYASSKFAIEGFFESLYYELFSLGIKVKLIEPGGVDTTFHQTAEEKFGINEDLKDYNSFTEKFMAKFEKMHDGMASAEQVTDVIYQAITDNTNQLRYIIGNDATSWIGARTGLKEADYISFMSNIYEL
ncbi:SDR family oxidoreductase [Chryseobacterium indologenes]|uniref:SDR family oxidoreductase n=1 Tax=Chryseobacterium indologenes TaxID=253 RepID=UPI0009A16F21|nr:SDR family oxidoreductase [Chryseobacterium indologenes]